MIFLKPPS
jgi:2-keto-4-pentenoate hydratase/2-oxohepta-3-ene-1,7-dioic acid hydratase in catechol pathway